MYPDSNPAPAPHEALLAALDVPPQQVAEALITSPAYARVKSDAAITGLYREVPISTPFGDTLLTVWDDPQAVPAPGWHGVQVAALILTRGVPFVINGRDYAPEEGGFTMYRTIEVRRVVHPVDSDPRTRMDLNSYGTELTDSAARKLRAWWDAEGQRLVTPLRVAAYRLARATRDAHDARAERDEVAETLARLDGEAQTATQEVTDTLAEWVRLSAESVPLTFEVALLEWSELADDERAEFTGEASGIAYDDQRFFRFEGETYGLAHADTYDDVTKRGEFGDGVAFRLAADECTAIVWRSIETEA